MQIIEFWNISSCSVGQLLNATAKFLKSMLHVSDRTNFKNILKVITVWRNVDFTK